MSSGTRGGFLQTAFGLRLRSALALPELRRLADDGTAVDVVIERGRVPRRLEGAVAVYPAMQVAADRFQLDVPAGRFRVSEGRRILVQPGSNASDADLRPYLLGTVMGALCHQRALLPLHAAAVVIGKDAVAFAGRSGAGKSTLAAHFHGRGRDVLADDLLAVDVGPDATPLALPGLARIRLRADSPDSRDGKVSVPVDGPAEGRALPLRRLYLLDTEGVDPPHVGRLRGPEAVAALLGQVYRWSITAAMGRGPAVFDQCLAVAVRCEVFQVRFTHAAPSPASLVEALEVHLAS